MPKPPVEFRIDDVCLNTNPEKLVSIVDALDGHGVITLAVGIVCYTLGEGDVPEYLFHTTDRCLSCPLELAHGDRIGVPPVLVKLAGRVRIASHGLFHGDHRLLSKGAQELSIVQSCATLQSSIFVPPWHHYNSKTKKVCRKHNIQLVRWSPAHRHAKFHPFQPADYQYYYFHTFDTDGGQNVAEWLEGKRNRV
jgi:hypothetical protein